MKIIVLGTRGIPGIQGGVETHCEELYPRLVSLGHDITIITRTPYVKSKKINAFKSVRLKHIFAPKNKTFEAIIHSFLGTLYAGYKRPDFLHIHTVGCMLLTPFAKLLGLKVIVTNHGPDYNRQKWGETAKRIIKLGERLGTKYADKIIVISELIDNILKNNYNRHDAVLIYNGVTMLTKSEKNRLYWSFRFDKSGICYCCWTICGRKRIFRSCGSLCKNQYKNKTRSCW